MELPELVGVMIVAVFLLLIAGAAPSFLPFEVLAVLIVVGVIFLVLVAIRVMTG